MSFLWVLLGAAVGAPTRYAVDRWARSRWSVTLPWPTLLVNVAGSLLLGLLLGVVHAHDLPDWAWAAGGTGFCGALTTWSTLGNETFTQARGDRPVRALLNVVLNLALGVAAAFAGYALA